MAPSGVPIFLALENVTAHLSAQWTARQLLGACCTDSTSRFLLRVNDSIYGTAFRRQVVALGIEEMTTAPRSPWQIPYAERVIGSIRRARQSFELLNRGSTTRSLDCDGCASCIMNMSGWPHELVV